MCVVHCVCLLLSVCSVAALPGPPICGEGILSLRSSALACSSYVALNLGDYVMALTYAQELLSSPMLSGALRCVCVCVCVCVRACVRACVCIRVS